MLQIDECSVHAARNVQLLCFLYDLVTQADALIPARPGRVLAYMYNVPNVHHLSNYTVLH